MSASAPDAFNIGLKYSKDVVVAQAERLSLGTAKPTVEIGLQAHALTNTSQLSRLWSQLQWLGLSRGC